MEKNLYWKKKQKQKPKTQAQNIQEIWDNMKRPNPHIIGIEGEETQVKRTENIFNKTIEEFLLI